MVLLAAWCVMRFDALAALRRQDLDPPKGIIHVRRGVLNSPRRSERSSMSRDMEAVHHTREWRTTSDRDRCASRTPPQMPKPVPLWDIFLLAR